MITEELRKYVRNSLSEGIHPGEIERTLRTTGWAKEDVCSVLENCVVKKKSAILDRGYYKSRIGIFTLVALVLVLAGVTLYLWTDRLDLANKNDQRVREFYTKLSGSQVAFTDAGELVFPDERKFRDQKNAYIENRASFLEADLRTMRLTLYEKGIASTSVAILTKGKGRSWWETPTGDYRVLGKSVNAYSSIGNVWMPYSIQFYGNYLIHGWPHSDDGTPVPQGYSGGCIRLSTEDAQGVYNFAKVGMPVLVLEDLEKLDFGMLEPKSTHSDLPLVSAASFLLTDLSSGETIVEKMNDKKLPIASLTKLMTAVVAHEVIYLGKTIKVTKGMLASVAQVFRPVAGDGYIGLDLLYPLLMQSSNDVANVLSGFVGDETFVRNMNAKAFSLQMNDTQFADPSGISPQNISTAKDLGKLLQYIYYKRPFLFDISRGVAFENVGLIKIGETVPIADLKNFNEFVGQPDLIGIKNGSTIAAKQTMASVWNIHTEKGDVPVAIIVLGSNDRKKDTEALLQWVKKNFAVL